MKQIYFIHENTTPVKLAGVNKQMTTDFVVTTGYISEPHEKDNHNPGDYNPVYSKDKGVEFENYLPGVFFNSYEDGCKMLTKVLAVRCTYDVTIRETFDKLVSQYPECAV